MNDRYFIQQIRISMTRCNILYAIEMWLLISCLALVQLILTMKPVWWPVLHHWPVLPGLCTHSFSFIYPQPGYKDLYTMYIRTYVCMHVYIMYVRMYACVYACVCWGVSVYVVWVLVWVISDFENWSWSLALLCTYCNCILTCISRYIRTYVCIVCWDG